MTIDEAIAHAREVAEGCRAENGDCAYQHDKLTEWLVELKAYRETGLKPEEIADFREMYREMAAKFADYKAAERCVLCGAHIADGSQMCRACMDKYSPAAVLETEQELRDIAQVLKITASTDRNIKESMEAILRIADRLGRNGNGR